MVILRVLYLLLLHFCICNNDYDEDYLISYGNLTNENGTAIELYDTKSNFVKVKSWFKYRKT